MASLLADENFPFPVTEALRRLGHDVATLDDLNLARIGLSDDGVLAEASRGGRCVLTLNRWDFQRLHGSSPAHAGIAVCTFDPDFDRQAARIDEALRRAGDPTGGLLRINRAAP